MCSSCIGEVEKWEPLGSHFKKTVRKGEGGGGYVRAIICPDTE